MKLEKLLRKARRSPSGLRFSELCSLTEALGFELQRQKGSYRVYAHEGIKQILNLQDDNGMAKAYQVRQLLNCIDRNQLTLEGISHG